MSFATDFSKDNAKTDERRSSRRKTLRRYVVLVFFGEDNWGKLTNMSETGMAFEFAKPPSLEERVNFTFQAMGGMPAPPNGKAPGDSFEAPGRIVWTREFERGAGVQFVDLAEASREQIREWLSIATLANQPGPPEQIKSEVEPIVAELLASLAPGSNTPTAESKKGTSIDLDMPLPLAEPLPQPDSEFLESSIGEPSDETSGWNSREPAKDPRLPELPATPQPSVARLTFLVVSGCLAAFVVTAGVRIFMTRAAERADAAVHTSDQAPVIGETAAEVNVSSTVPASVSSLAGPVTSTSEVSAPPFQVGVLDNNGRNWILWFVRGGAKDKNSQIPYRLSEASNSPAPTMGTTKPQEAVSPEKLQAAHTFTMAAPNVSHPVDASAAGQPTEAPAIQPELTPSSNTFGGALVSQMKPAAPALHAPTGGMVQQPRLIRAAPLVYPQLAKSTRVAGDVLVDALIDATGSVTTVKALSGPVLLQQAAMETVRHWKYEPARLDGQAVSMHLSVTVRFRLN